MGMVSDKLMDFLNNGGFDLGYDEWELPKLDDMDAVLENSVHVWDYIGLTEAQYYGFDLYEGRLD